jgi:DNA-binding transcriptional LysR family regulator
LLKLMDRTYLRRADLNLLVVFQVLIDERHVGRAAARLGLTQSATSQALGRLRQMFDDPLFVRHPKGISPTSRAIELAPAIAEILDRAESVIAGAGSFDPHAPCTFTVGSADLGVFTILLPLMQQLRSNGPGIDIRIRSLDLTRVVAAFDRQEIDLALMPFPDPPARIKRQPVLKERYVGIARRGNPALNSKLTAKRWAALPHLLISPTGETHTESDDRLAELGLKRRIVMAVPHFLAAPFVVATTDLVAVMAQRIARHFAAELDLAIFEPPVPLHDFTIDLLTSTARKSDPALRWLIEQISQVCSGDRAREGLEMARRRPRAKSAVAIEGRADMRQRPPKRRD